MHDGAGRQRALAGRLCAAARGVVAAPLQIPGARTAPAPVPMPQCLDVFRVSQPCATETPEQAPRCMCKTISMTKCPEDPPGPGPEFGWPVTGQPAPKPRLCTIP